MMLAWNTMLLSQARSGTKLPPRGKREKRGEGVKNTGRGRGGGGGL